MDEDGDDLRVGGPSGIVTEGFFTRVFKIAARSRCCAARKRSAASR